MAQNMWGGLGGFPAMGQQFGGFTDLPNSRLPVFNATKLMPTPPIGVPTHRLGGNDALVSGPVGSGVAATSTGLPGPHLGGVMPLPPVPRPQIAGVMQPPPQIPPVFNPYASPNLGLRSAQPDLSFVRGGMPNAVPSFDTVNNRMGALYGMAMGGRGYAPVTPSNGLLYKGPSRGY